MGEINFAQYSSAFPRFLTSWGFHPVGASTKSRESPRLLVETAFFTPLSTDLGYISIDRNEASITLKNLAIIAVYHYTCSGHFAL